MALPYIVLGCPTTGGGKVITGNSSFLIEGIPVACVGDKATCPKHKTVATIVSGDPYMLVMGKAVARVNDKLSCGCKLLQKQYLVVGDNGGSIAQGYQENNTKSNLMPQSDEHGIKFKLLDENTGQPLVEQYFKITAPTGEVFEGFTDGTGQTELVKSGKEAKEVDLITFDLSKPLPEWN